MITKAEFMAAIRALEARPITPPIIWYHPRVYHDVQHLAALMVEIGERAAKELLDPFSAAAARMMLYDWGVEP